MQFNRRRCPVVVSLIACCLGLLPAPACLGQAASSSFLTRPGTPVVRLGDEIIVCGQLFHTGAPVVLWLDPGGYDAYRVDKHFEAPAAPTTRRTPRSTTKVAREAPPATTQAATTQSTTTQAATGPTSRTGRGGFQRDRESVQARYSSRKAPLTDEEVEQTRNGNWTLPLLQDKVDQFVLHYDVAGLSQTCFKVLHDMRNLSVHFMLDIDGTIYQTVDLKEETWHATSANGRSIGVEIANMGAYHVNSSPLVLKEWYQRLPGGQTRITIPSRLGNGGVRTPNFIGRPARPEMVVGIVQGSTYRQYDFTPQQYESLIKLTATLCTVFPKITCDYPRQKTALGPPSTAPATQATAGDPTTRPAALAGPGEPGNLIPHVLTDEQFDGYQGILGHYHVQIEKQDPGPAMQWDRVINGARALMSPVAKMANQKARGHPARFVPSKPATTAPTTTEVATPAAPEQ
jgi:N-acetylmuramoyl-L-alanine amidase